MNRLIIRIPFSVLLAFWTLLPLESSGAQREGKAVFETSPQLGFRLQPKARENIQVRIMKIAALPPSVPTSAIVHFQDKTGVYRLRDDWFKLVEVQASPEPDGKTSLRSGELRIKDEIVVNGAGLLRVSEMDATGSEE